MPVISQVDVSGPFANRTTWNRILNEISESSANNHEPMMNEELSAEVGNLFIFTIAPLSTPDPPSCPDRSFLVSRDCTSHSDTGGCASIKSVSANQKSSRAPLGRPRHRNNKQTKQARILLKTNKIFPLVPLINGYILTKWEDDSQ